MKFSDKMERCGLSPMRKFAPYAAKAEAKGLKLYHLNIGQPDIETPPVYFDTVKSFSQPVLAYAPSAGVPVLLEAIRDYLIKNSVVHMVSTPFRKSHIKTNKR